MAITQIPVTLVTMGLASAIALGGCDVEPKQVTSKTVLIRSSVFYADPEDQKRFKEALKSASIPHEVSPGADGNEYESWAGDYDAAVENIKTQLFGEPLPGGRHIHFGGDFGDRFKAWLTASNISFQTTVRRGKEYVIWSAEDSPKVAKWEYFPRHYWQRAQSPSSPTVETDARKSGARGSP